MGPFHHLFATSHRTFSQTIGLRVFGAAGDVAEIPTFSEILEMLTGELAAIVGEKMKGRPVDRKVSCQLFNNHG